MKKINALAIRIDGGTQSRKELNQEKVQEYAELMRDGIVFPPITVFFDGTDYWLSAGFHRFFAQKEIGNVAIDCEVIDGTVRQAKWHSWGSNSHGLPHTQEEKKLIALEILKDPEYSKYSNVQIGKHIGVSHATISRYRASLGEKQKEVVYTDKHGNEATMKVAAKKPKKEPKKTKVKKEAEKAPDIQELEQKLDEAGRTILQQEEETIKLRDILASKRYNATEIEQEDALVTIQELREEIKMKDFEIQSLRESRDMYMERTNELIRQINAMKKRK